MTYPLSSDVSSGQPTAAGHYNTLRADALRLGQAEADGVTLGTALAQLQHNITLVYLATNRLRVTAASTAPAHLAVDGVLLSTSSNVDLPSGSVPSGAAAAYYVFAVRSAGYTGFTLDINTSPADSTGRRNIGSFYWDGSNIVRESIRTAWQDALNSALALQNQLEQRACGRLTLTSGAPVPAADVASSGTLYYTPHLGNRVALYVSGFGWKVYPFSEVALSLSGISASTNYDVFLYDNLGTLTLALEAWANDTTRSAALAWQDGVPVRSGLPHKRYLGTIRASGAGVCADTQTQRFVWNLYNPAERGLYCVEATSHTYASATARLWNNSTTNNKLEFVRGLNLTPVKAWQMTLARISSATYCSSLGIVMDTSSGFQSGNGPSTYSTANEVLAQTLAGMPAEGYHYLSVCENTNSASGTGTFGWMNLYALTTG